MVKITIHYYLYVYIVCISTCIFKYYEIHIIMLRMYIRAYII